IDLGRPLFENARKIYGPGYAKALEMVRNDTSGLLLIAAVVQVPRVEYVFNCDDPFKLINRLPRIRDMIHARVETELLSEHEIRVTLTPVQGTLTIGVTPVRGERLLLTTDQARSALGHDLAFALKESYAFEIPVPNIVHVPPEPLISPNDSEAQVVAKYKQAIVPAIRPSGATTQSGGSGRVLVPGPASRPTQPQY
ncbi:MAG TPA: hypothetical protein VG326_17730, partial [Tepidisphaeraceae bacterium]|nr:hypothetical protein [Tepidisphaeraceae bacterium]